METKIENSVDEVDVEEFARAGKPIPKAKRYRIRVDKVKFTVEVSEMTGREILVLAGKEPPERYLLNQKKHGGVVEPIAQNQVVDFTAPGIERFMTLPMDQNEGQ